MLYLAFVPLCRLHVPLFTYKKTPSVDLLNRGGRPLVGGLTAGSEASSIYAVTVGCPRVPIL